MKILTTSVLLLAAAAAVTGPALIKSDSEAPGQNKVTITVKDDKRVIESNGIPDHKVAKYPAKGNPNTISDQKHRFEVPANPKPATGKAGIGGSAWGVALNSVGFDPGTADV